MTWTRLGQLSEQSKDSQHMNNHTEKDLLKKCCVSTADAAELLSELWLKSNLNTPITLAEWVKLECCLREANAASMELSARAIGQKPK